MTGSKLTTFLVLLAAILYPLLIKDLYFMHIAILIGIYLILAVSLNLLLGYAGQLSLGHAAFFGVGAYTSSLLWLNLKIPMWGGMPMALMTSGLLGYIVAKVAFKLRGAYFVIMTIGVAEVLKLVGLNWVDLTKGPMGLTEISAPSLHLGSLGSIDFGDKTPYYYLTLMIVLICLFFQKRIIHSSFGRAFVSIRENEDLAESVGINSYKYLVIVVIISASMAGVAGSLYAHYVSFIDPNVFAFFISVNVVMMVIGGGQGTFVGPVIGAIVFSVIPELLRALGNSRMAVYSLFIIFIVIFMPRGIPFYLSQLWSMRNRIPWMRFSKSAS